MGLVSERRYKMVLEKKSKIEKTHEMLRAVRLKPTKETNEMLNNKNIEGIKKSCDPGRTPEKAGSYD